MPPTILIFTSLEVGTIIISIFRGGIVLDQKCAIVSQLDGGARIQTQQCDFRACIRAGVCLSDA